MNKKYLYSALLFSFCIYICTLIYKLPASLLKPAFSHKAPVQVDQLLGTVWSGSIPNMQVKINNGLINIGQLHWQLKLSCLLTLKACADVQLSPNEVSQGDIHLDTQAQLSLAQVFQLKATQADLDASWLMEMSALPISAVGRIKLDSEQIAFSEKENLPSIDGELRWQKAGIDYPEEYELGNYVLSFSTEGEGENKMVTGILRDEDGLISSNGDIKLAADTRVDIDLTISPNSKTPDSLTSTLSLLGKPNAKGAYNIRHQTFLKTIF